MSAPPLTVAMSALDAERTVGRSLRSLQRQTFTDWRLLVIDDGSRDATVEIVSGLARDDARIELLRGGERRGLAQRLNELLDAASGTLLARMDADDVAHPDRFARQVECLDEHPEIDLLGTSMLIIDADGRPRGIRPAPAHHEQICARPQAGFPLFHPTWTGRLAWFRRFRYDLRAERCEDQDLLLRAHRESRFANLPEPLLAYQEDRLAWGNIRRGRAIYARRAIADSRRRGRRAEPIAIALEQTAKGVADALAIGLRAEDRLLRHRARPLPAAERARWEPLLAALESPP